MRFALDTNVLAYAEGVNGPEKKRLALDLVERLPPELTGVPVQALGELFRVLVGKAARSPANARAAILHWGDAFPLIETSGAVLLGAADLAVDHHLGIWDALMIAAAADAGCRLLLSEDLQEGFTWGGTTIVNPFAADRHEMLDAYLDEDVR
jgi:predicted nucleic acid-binding protein